MVEAYPIIVFTKQLEDRSRKIMEIIEGEDYQDGRLIAHSLYKYEVEDNVTDDRGETRVVGHHKKIGLISDSLKKRLDVYKRQPPSSLPSREMLNWAGSGILTW